MEKQQSIADIEYENRKRKTKWDEFLGIMEEVIPWDEWRALVERYYPQRKKWTSTADDAADVSAGELVQSVG